MTATRDCNRQSGPPRRPGRPARSAWNDLPFGTALPERFVTKFTLMAGAVAFRVRVHDAMPLIAGDAAIMVIAGVTAALRAVSA